MIGARQLLLSFLLLAPLGAQELSLLVGSGQTPDRTDRAVVWELDYRSRLWSRFSVSGSYLNEGHLAGHKRDGLACQGWYSLPLFRKKLSLDFGAGFYGYADTAIIGDKTFENVSGMGRLYSVSATFRPAASTFARLQLNRVHIGGAPDSNQALLGVGYRLGKVKAEEEPAPGTSTTLEAFLPDEITVFMGQSVLNSIQDQKGLAFGAEIRKGLADHCDWTFTWLHEGDPQVVRRNGLGSQVWLVGSYMPGKLTLGVGAGVYAFLDEKLQKDDPKSYRDNLGGLVSLTAAYRFKGPWAIRAIWNRVLTHNSRDTDDFVVGLGYRVE
ncbi:MAG: hypothetical protein H6Q00_632 [Holophagaceae bacterium]|nr:hypothetical protein [Holophagaceae bacterium]